LSRPSALQLEVPTRRFEVAADSSSQVSGKVNSALPVCWRLRTPTMGIVHQLRTSVTLPAAFLMPRPCRRTRPHKW